MRTMSAKEAKNHFGELLMEAQKEPVTIEKNGKPVAVMHSLESHQAAEEAKLEWIRARLAEADQAYARGEYEEFGSAKELIDSLDNEDMAETASN